MKTLILITILCTVSAQANAGVMCRSSKDWNFIQSFPGYNCPPGWLFVRIIT